VSRWRYDGGELVVPADGDEGDVQSFPRETGGCVLESRDEVWWEVVRVEDGGACLQGGGYPIFEGHDGLQKYVGRFL
jgi:hypothetical protein